MKLISWNVNGIRAVMKRNDMEQILDMNPDILFLQETKASPDQIDTNFFTERGYSTYFAHSTVRKGYSGVGIISKIPFDEVKIGLEIEHFDLQGRALTVFHGKRAYINVYVPNGGGAIAPLAFKLEFIESLIEYMQTLVIKGYEVVLGGDVNVAHTEIDLARPYENRNSIGFLPEERAYLDNWFEGGFSDVFRTFYPDTKEMYTYWDQKSAARDRNVGWRIDYWIASQAALKDIKSIRHLTSIYGSDHCPIELTLKD